MFDNGRAHIFDRRKAPLISPIYVAAVTHSDYENNQAFVMKGVDNVMRTDVKATGVLPGQFHRTL